MTRLTARTATPYGAAMAVVPPPPQPAALVPAVRWQPQFQTTRPDEAIESVEKLYGPHSLALRTRQGLDMRLAGFDIGRLTVSRIEYGCVATARTEEPHDYWVFSCVARGEIVVGKELARAGNAGVRAPETMGEVPMSADLQLCNLKVPHADLLEASRTLFGEVPAEPLRFPELVVPGSAPAVHLANLMQRLNELPTCMPSPAAALVERRWQEAALLELLMAWPHSWQRLLVAGAPARGAVDRALDFIHADPGAAVTLQDIAQAAGVGIRALNRGFEKRLGTTPMRYLVRCRLERARAELLDGAGSVTEIAYRWGFGNLGDFAGRYRELFGERPSETRRGN
jgi:AraC-like DNA-binding protein